MAAIEELLAKAQGHLSLGQFAEAKAAAEAAFAAAPTDDRARELYANVYLAHGIRLAGLARETRRQEIETRGKAGEGFEDSETVRGLFRETLGAFERVLSADPDHVKAHSLRAQALFRLDRGNREAALSAYDEAAGAVARTLSEGPARETALRNLLSARRRIERSCEWCDDTGFCTECNGSGWKTVFGFRKKCEACLGHGTCKRCGVL